MGSECSLRFWSLAMMGEFDHLRSRNPIEVNRTTGVRLGSISKRSVDYTRIYTRVLVEYDIKGKYPEKYLNVDKVKSDKR